MSCFSSLRTYAGDGTESVETAGDVVQILLPVTAGAMTLYKNDGEGSSQFAKSFLTTLGTTYVLKYTINSERPNGGDYSFPSGHTSAAFSGASFLQKRYGWEYGIPAYLAASFVGWSRIEADKHYAGDVLAGAAIGIASTYIFTDLYEEGVAVTPYTDGTFYGLMLNATF